MPTRSRPQLKQGKQKPAVKGEAAGFWPGRPWKSSEDGLPDGGQVRRSCACLAGCLTQRRLPCVLSRIMSCRSRVSRAERALSGGTPSEAVEA
jgi:hypothetical protein